MRLIDGDALIAWIKESQHMTSKMRNIICKVETMPSADRPQVNAELRADFLKRQYESALEEIKRLKADRPQGKWIRDRYWSRGVGMGEEYGFFYKCSMCEYEVESGYTRCGFNYCPYCGADMRGDRRWEMK